jgi:flagellar biosynthesis/type III secretory pathway chaperone
LIDKEAMESCCGVMVKVCSCESEESGELTKQQLSKADLASLLERKKKIESELQYVQKRIEELKARKRG